MEHTPDTGLIVFAHGSRVAEANEAVHQVARDAAAQCGVELWAAAFLELAEPDLNTALERLVALGVRRIVVMPYFLTMGIHLQRDLPALLREASSRYSQVELVCSPPLDGHSSLADIVADRVRQFLR